MNSSVSHTKIDKRRTKTYAMIGQLHLSFTDERVRVFRDHKRTPCEMPSLATVALEAARSSMAPFDHAPAKVIIAPSGYTWADLEIQFRIEADLPSRLVHPLTVEAMAKNVEKPVIAACLKWFDDCESILELQEVKGTVDHLAGQLVSGARRAAKKEVDYEARLANLKDEVIRATEKHTETIAAKWIIEGVTYQITGETEDPRIVEAATKEAIQWSSKPEDEGFFIPR